jgi:hypothetical protein
VHSDDRLWQAGAVKLTIELPLHQGKQGGTAAEPAVPAARCVLWGFFNYRIFTTEARRKSFFVEPGFVGWVEGHNFLSVWNATTAPKSNTTEDVGFRFSTERQTRLSQSLNPTYIGMNSSFTKELCALRGEHIMEKKSK